MSYRNLEIWQLARELTVGVHTMTIERLPKFELYEQGSQIRKSMKSVKSNIVEGYGRRRYKQDFIIEDFRISHPASIMLHPASRTPYPASWMYG